MVKPLAYRMRPKKIEDIIGQQHLVGEGKIIKRMVDAKMLSSMILYGPPGTGKTSIANAIACSTNYAFRKLNAATNSKKDLLIVAEEAKISGTIILLLDEIHRLDKTKQDFLLPHLESGRIILIGSTTENPYITINPAIRSRTQIFEVYPLTPDNIKKGIYRALTDKQNGLGNWSIFLDKVAENFLINSTSGDLRSALNGLELSARSTKKNSDNSIHLTLSIIEECLQHKSFLYDKDGDAYYNVISAFQKSIRGSDTDASLHYLARLLISGDLQSITRRLLVIAYEDIGLANPPACARTLNAILSAERLGLPEARIPLVNAVIELCLSPKSNSGIVAMDAAIKDVEKGNIGDVPNILKDANYKGSKNIGHGIDYKYPHNYENDWVAQQYLPPKINNVHYYKPKKNSKYESAFSDQYYRIWQAQHNMS